MIENTESGEAAMNRNTMFRYMIICVMATASLFTASCDDDNAMANDPTESSPLPAPVGNLIPETDAPLHPTLVWKTAGEDGDTVVYDVYLGMTTSPTIVATGLTDTTFDPGPLQPGTAYYWAVRANVNGEPTAQSAVWRFVTRTGITYPVAVGNRWEYRCELTVQEPRIGYYMIDVEEIDYSWADQPAYVFHERYADLDRAIFDSCRTYYYQADTGMYVLGYDSVGSVMPASENSSQQYRFNGATYETVEDLLSGVHLSDKATIARPADVVVEEPPLLGLQYPIEVDSAWIYRDSLPYRIEKEVVAYETISAPAGLFGCFVVEWHYDTGNDGTFDNDIQRTDYISEEGLVQRSVVMLDVEIIVLGQVIDIVDIYADYELVALELR